MNLQISNIFAEIGRLIYGIVILFYEDGSSQAVRICDMICGDRSFNYYDTYFTSMGDENGKAIF